MRCGRRLQFTLLTLLAVFFWFATSVGAFQSVYMQEQGFSTAQLGIINAVASAVNILAISFWGVVSDWSGSLKKTLVAVMVFGFGLNAMVPLFPTGQSYSFLIMAIMLSVVKFFNGPMLSLTENLLVRRCAEEQFSYGGIRSTASLSYAVGGIAATLLIARAGTPATFWASGLLGIPAVILLICTRSPDSSSKVRQGRRFSRADLAALIGNGRYLAFLSFNFLFYVAIYCQLSFLPYYMDAIGLDSGRYGMVLAYSALLEIPGVLLLKGLYRFFGYRKLIALSACLTALEALLLSTCCNSMGMLLLSTTFYGLGYGLSLAASLNYIYELAPASMKASAQSFSDATAAVAGIVGNLLGGILLGVAGAKQFYFVLFIVYVLGVLMLLTSRETVRRAK